MPQDGPKRAPGIILRDLPVARRTFLGPSWAHLGLSWALLGPSRGGPEGLPEADVGLGRLDLGVQLRNIKVFGRFPKESLQSGCLEVLLWVRSLEESNLDARLASSWCQQGKLELQVNQTCSRELACWEQLEVR